MVLGAVLSLALLTPAAAEVRQTDGRTFAEGFLEGGEHFQLRDGLALTCAPPPRLARVTVTLVATSSLADVVIASVDVPGGARAPAVLTAANPTATMVALVPDDCIANVRLHGLSVEGLVNWRVDDATMLVLGEPG